MSQTTPIAIVQMCATAEVTANLEKTRELSDAAANAGARVVFLPEAYAYIGSDRDRQPWLEDLPAGGPILETCREIAQAHRVDVVAGGFPERAGDNRSYNTCIHVDPNGVLAARYRKIHLFDVDLADGTRLLESKATVPGVEAVTTRMPFGTLGLSVCYDVRFPALYQDLVDAGSIAITIPSAFTKTTGQDHWHVLLRARAIECQAYVIAPAQHGAHGHRNRQSFGHALVVDPWGRIVAECDDGDGFAIASIDPAEVERVRRELPSLANRRTWH